MRNREDLKQTREEAQHFANERQAVVTLYLREGRFDYIEQARFQRENDPRNAYISTIRPRYRYLDDIKRRNARAGNHWFKPDTMRYFGSRVHSSIYTRGNVAYFVTSEKPPHARRAYSVRRANADGSIDTVGEFCGFSTGRAAHARAAYIATHGEGA